MHIHYWYYTLSINTWFSTSGEIIPNKYSSLIDADSEVFVSLKPSPILTVVNGILTLVSLIVTFLVIL
jgi:hypothetical protein